MQTHDNTTTITATQTLIFFSFSTFRSILKLKGTDRSSTARARAEVSSVVPAPTCGQGRRSSERGRSSHPAKQQISKLMIMTMQRLCPQCYNKSAVALRSALPHTAIRRIIKVRNVSVSGKLSFDSVFLIFFFFIFYWPPLRPPPRLPTPPTRV